MENKEFQIIPLQGRSLLVVILSSEMTNYYWKELQTELANLNIADAEVYFDFLYRNGLKNRFFKSKLKGMMLISNSLRKCEAPKEYVYPSSGWSIQAIHLFPIQRHVRRILPENGYP